MNNIHNSLYINLIIFLSRNVIMSRFSKFFSLDRFKKTKKRRCKKQKRRNTRRRYMRGG
jgi:hypothetical protein